MNNSRPEIKKIKNKLMNREKLYDRWDRILPENKTENDKTKYNDFIDLNVSLASRIWVMVKQNRKENVRIGNNKLIHIVVKTSRVKRKLKIKNKSILLYFTFSVTYSI